VLRSAFNKILFLASKIKLAWPPRRERGRKKKKRSDLAVCYSKTNTHKCTHTRCDTHKTAWHDLCLEENTNTPEKQRACGKGKCGIIHFSKA